MKHTILLILSASLAASAAVPLSWTVETSRATPAVFEAYQGETLALEAVLQSYGKPLEAPLNYALYWQTNGMGSAYWSSPCAAAVTPTNVLFATWSPTNDVGARAYNCFIGAPGTIYHAAFQLRLRPSPGATPNALPLPQPVIDFSTVTVLNPPWGSGSSGGVDTNAVREIVSEVSAPMTNALDAAKRDKTDLAVYDRAFVWSNADAAISDYLQTNPQPRYNSYGGYWEMPYLPNGWNPNNTVEGDGSETNFTHVGWHNESGDVAFADCAINERAFVRTGDRLATTNDVAVAKAAANEALSAANDANAWSSATYNFMTGGRTNCWFSGTNYVFGAEAAARTRFAWEDGMDAATVPCSMALWEIRDGERQVVCDQRDWTAWFWSFKARQMQEDVAGQIAALGRAVTNDANYAWAKRYASDGTPNPDASTTFIDTPSVTLSPGMKWETVATVSGSAYWTIVGNGAVIGGSGTNATLLIKDFEGNEIMTVTKGEHRLAYLEQGEITDGPLYDGNGWVCFDMLANAEPVGYFSVTLDASDFIEQTDPDCPAQCSWEDLHNGKYRVHFLLKPGIQARSCFAKFKVEVEGQTVIRYNAGQEISGGLLFNGVKIAPDVSGNPAVGTVIQWKVVR